MIEEIKRFIQSNFYGILTCYKAYANLWGVSDWELDKAIAMIWFIEIVDEISVEDWLQQPSDERSHYHNIPTIKPIFSSQIPMQDVEDSIQA